MSVIETILAILGSNAATSYLTFLFSKKKYLAEASNSELEAVEKSISIYRGMVEDLGQRIDIMSSNIKSLYLEKEVLVKENSGLKKRVQEMDKIMKKLQRDAQNNNNP